MKKTLIILSGGLAVLFFVMTLLPTFNQLYFYIKHISFYLLISIISISLLIYLYKRIIEKNSLYNNKLIALQVFTLLFAGSILYLIGNIQLNYIDKYESPLLTSCTYYDNYGNVIYSSQFYNVCPELGDVVYTNSGISFSVTESSNRVYEDYTSNGIYIPDQNLSVYRLTEISIEYTTDNLIENVSILSSTNIESDLLGEFNKKFYSLKIDVSNTYTENSFETINDYYFYEVEEHNFSSLEDIKHYNFSIDDRERKITTSEIIFDTENIGHITLSRHKDNDIEPNIIALGTLSNIDDDIYSKQINMSVQFGYLGLITGGEREIFIGDNSIKEIEYYFSSTDDFKSYIYDRVAFDQLILTEDTKIGGDFNREYITNIYDDTLKGILIIEKNSEIITIEKIEYGFLVKEHAKINYCKITDCSIAGLNHPDWYYWNAEGIELFDLYDYEKSFFYNNRDSDYIKYDNPLISIYYD